LYVDTIGNYFERIINKKCKFSHISALYFYLRSYPVKKEKWLKNVYSRETIYIVAEGVCFFTS